MKQFSLLFQKLFFDKLMRNEPDLQITTKVNVIYFFNDIEKRWNIGLPNALMNEGYTF